MMRVIEDPLAQEELLLGLRVEIVLGDSEGLPLSGIVTGYIAQVTKDGIHVDAVAGEAALGATPVFAAVGLGDAWGVFDAFAARVERGARPETLVVRLLGDVSLRVRERRSAERVTCKLPIRLTPKTPLQADLPDLGGKWIPGTILDISSGGMQIELEVPLPVGLHVAIRFTLEGIDCEAIAKVIHLAQAADRILIGIELIEVPVVDRSVIQAFAYRHLARGDES